MPLISSVLLEKYLQSLCFMKKQFINREIGGKAAQRGKIRNLADNQPLSCLRILTVSSASFSAVPPKYLVFSD